MNIKEAFALALDPARILRAQGLEPDPWQVELLACRDPFLLLNCSRQAGKSTTVAALALHHLLFSTGCLVLLASPSERQSHELFRKVLDGWRALGRPVAADRLDRSHIELANGSRLVALPGREATIRSFSGVDLLLLDEAARVPDDLYRSVRPMLAVSRGRLAALSTPFGQRGWFHGEWSGGGPWRRFHVPWTLCPRIDPAFIAEETRALGPLWVAQEYEAEFTVLQGLVFPDLPAAVLTETPAETPAGLRVGGIDFGWRNPFAAVWGTLDAGDVLWLEGERYGRETPLADHAAVLPRDVIWYADPAGASEIAELRRLGLVLRRGHNPIRPGIARITERLRTGRLKILPGACPNLVAESRLYRWSDADAESENPIDRDNHALAALRYLLSRLPWRSPQAEDGKTLNHRGTETQRRGRNE